MSNVAMDRYLIRSLQKTKSGNHFDLFATFRKCRRADSAAKFFSKNLERYQQERHKFPNNAAYSNNHR